MSHIQATLGNGGRRLVTQDPTFTTPPQRSVQIPSGTLPGVGQFSVSMKPTQMNTFGMSEFTWTARIGGLVKDGKPKDSLPLT
jgi:hypothetical protein